MSDRDDYKYPEQVVLEIVAEDQAAYRPAADYLNRVGYDVLSVQHEYGIFGGEAGNYLMNLIREVKMPVVTTLHTVLSDPSAAQKTVMDELLQLSERVVVMSEKAVGFLRDVHQICPHKVDLIPHGAPNVYASVGQEFRAKLAIDGPMILTFGLLSPDKGIQYVIEAMPEIVRQHPGATYMIVGATHPNVRASSGEQYRESLAALAETLGVSTSVRFVNRFVETEELVEYLGAMDIYITPYLNAKQITSGTLAYAVGAGKAVISTPYVYAEDLLSDGRGMLVPFRDAESIAQAVIALEREPDVRHEMSRKAAEFGVQMLWPEVGKRYLATFARAKTDAVERLRSLTRTPRVTKALPEIHLGHLFALSDDTGILQHATFTTPNRSEGYCVDDNARALLLTAQLENGRRLPADLSMLQSRYLGFVLEAFNTRNGRFRNFMSYGRDWLEDAGSEDSHGRSLWALGAMTRRCSDPGRRDLAKVLFEVGSPALRDTTSMRTWAYGILGAHEYLTAYPQHAPTLEIMGELADRLWQQYSEQWSETWPWFESRLTYANARLPQAFLLAGDALGNHDMLAAGLTSLEWLMDLQVAPSGCFAPIGSNGFYPRETERSYYDQQPIEAWASVSACLAAQRITGNPTWLGEAQRAFGWFLGENMLNQSLYDASSGGCHDGLHAERINRNQGAESTLSYLCALGELREATAIPTAAKTKATLL